MLAVPAVFVALPGPASARSHALLFCSCLGRDPDRALHRRPTASMPCATLRPGATASSPSPSRSPRARAGCRSSCALYRRIAFPLVLWVPLAAVLTIVFGNSLPTAPGSDVPIIFFKAGDAGVHLAGIAAFVLLGLYAWGGCAPPSTRSACGSSGCWASPSSRRSTGVAWSRPRWRPSPASSCAASRAGWCPSRWPADAVRRGVAREPAGRPGDRAVDLVRPDRPELDQHLHRARGPPRPRRPRSGAWPGGARSSTTRSTAPTSGPARATGSTSPRLTASWAPAATCGLRTARRSRCSLAPGCPA